MFATVSISTLSTHPKKSVAQMGEIIAIFKFFITLMPLPNLQRMKAFM